MEHAEVETNKSEVPLNLKKNGLKRLKVSYSPNLITLY